MCSFCEGVSSEVKRTEQDIQKSVVRDFLDEYSYHEDKDIALLISMDTDLVHVKKMLPVCSEERIRTVHDRFKYFLNKNNPKSIMQEELSL